MTGLPPGVVPYYFGANGGRKGKTRRSDNMKRLWADPEWRARRIASAKATIARLNADPDFCARRAAAVSAEMTARWQDPEKREGLLVQVRAASKLGAAKRWRKTDGEG